jgi:hypothetical protein
MKGRVDGLLVGFFAHALALHSDVHPIIGPEEREGGVSAALAAPVCSLRVCLGKARIRPLHARLETAPGDLCLRVYPEDHDDEHTPRLAAGGTVRRWAPLELWPGAGALEHWSPFWGCSCADSLKNCGAVSRGLEKWQATPRFLPGALPETGLARLGASIRCRR